jgi:hypothetical protein
MSQITPPPEQVHESPRRRVRTHLMQIFLAGLTIFVTVYCYQIHVFLGLTVTFLAKHILVAILAAGMKLPIRETKTPQ